MASQQAFSKGRSTQELLADYESQLQANSSFDALKRKYGVGNSSGSSNFFGNTASDSSSASSRFSAPGLSEFAGTLDDATQRAKDLALFRVGLDERQGKFNRTLREEEAQSEFGRGTQQRQQDFGFNTALQGQQISGTQSLEQLRQASETARLSSQLARQKEAQEADISQQNYQSAWQRAGALRGFRGRF